MYLQLDMTHKSAKANLLGMHIGRSLMKLSLILQVEVHIFMLILTSEHFIFGHLEQLQVDTVTIIYTECCRWER